MARTQVVSVQNNFTGGLITENTALNFPDNACTDSLNCIFDYTGRVFRRPPVDIEQGYVLGDPIPVLDTDAFTNFTWEHIGLNGNFSFLVQQTGTTLRFFDITASTIVSAGRKVGTIDLTTFQAAGNTSDPGRFPCQYAEGNGVIIIVNKACDPFFIEYDPTQDLFSATRITLQFRDFRGLEDPFLDSERPSFSTILSMRSDNEGAIHYYNLLNQGWWQGTITAGDLSATSALGMWDADATAGSPAVGTMPSNQDQVSFYRLSETVSYDADRLISYQQGNTAAPKGHFILDVGSVDRRQAVEDDGLTLDLSGNAGELLAGSVGTPFGDMTASTAGSSLAASSDGDISDTYPDSLDPNSLTGSATGISGGATTCYVGKNFTADGGKKIFSVVVYSPTLRNSSGTTFKGYALSYSFGFGGVPFTATVRLYGKSTLPASSSDGTLLGSAIFTANTINNSITISSNDQATLWNYVWVEIDSDAGASQLALLTELQISEAVPIVGTVSFSEPDVSVERPQTVAYYAGRVFYGGIEDDVNKNSIYFSQVIENTFQYGRCYQQNDPTSEIFFNLLPSDGGVIRIPEMGRLTRLITYQTALIVIATNGVWIIRGSSAIGFTATDFVVRKLTSYGSHSALSVVEVNGLPIWWGDEGILGLQYNPQFDSFSVESLTDTTIRSYYTSIPAQARALAKGEYDQYSQFVVWLHGDATTGSRYEYTDALVYNSRTKAFFPLTSERPTGVKSRGLTFIEDNTGTQTPTFKYVLTYAPNATDTYLLFADQQAIDPTSAYDWTTFADEVSLNPADRTDSPAHFITGYNLDGQTMKYFQPNYIMFFLDQNGNDDTSSCYVQGIFDYTTSGNSGRWSSKQQVFNSGLTERNVNTRRMKIRGRGRSLQFKVSSEAGKPFSLIGWSVWKTISSDV